MSDSCDPIDCSPPGSSVHGILQARILERVAISFSRGTSRPLELNPGLPHCRQMLYQLSNTGKQTLGVDFKFTVGLPTRPLRKSGGRLSVTSVRMQSASGPGKEVSRGQKIQFFFF